MQIPKCNPGLWGAAVCWENARDWRWDTCTSTWASGEIWKLLFQVRLAEQNWLLLCESKENQQGPDLWLLQEEKVFLMGSLQRTSHPAAYLLWPLAPFAYGSISLVILHLFVVFFSPSLSPTTNFSFLSFYSHLSSLNFLLLNLHHFLWLALSSSPALQGSLLLPVKDHLQIFTCITRPSSLSLIKRLNRT